MAADNNITSRITTVRDSYGRFMDLLPEEMNDNTVQELNNARTQLIEVLTEDGNTLDNLLAQTNFRFSVHDFEIAQFTIRRAFLMRNDQFHQESERIQYSLGQWAMSRDVLRHLAEQMIDLLPAIRAEFNEFTTATTSSAATDANAAGAANLSPQHRRQTRVGSFIHMTRGFHDFFGCAVNIQDVIIDYEEFFDFLVRRIGNPNHPFQPRREVRDIPHNELLAGVRELLLRGNFGRFTPSPILRSALEVIITRTLLDTDHSGRYRRRRVVVERSFEMADILNVVDNLHVRFLIGTDVVRRMYEWGNISTHRGTRMRHTEIWYLLNAIQQITQQGIVQIPDNQVNQAWDDILDALVARGVITIV